MKSKRKTPSTAHDAQSKRPAGNETSILKRLSSMPPIRDFDEYDARAIKDKDELGFLNNYELCREAIRQALLRMPRHQAKTLERILKAEPPLIVFPTVHGDMDYLNAMSEAVVLWENCAPGAPFPPPFMSIVDKFRPFIAKHRREAVVAVELMTGPIYAKPLHTQLSMRTILVHVPLDGDKASLHVASEQVTNAMRASGWFDNNGGGRPATDFLALAYFRACQGQKEAKAHLRFSDKLRADDEGQTVFGKKLYAPAIENVLRSPSEAAWSEALIRIEQRVMKLANRLMLLVKEGHLKPTPKKKRGWAHDLD